ncbi:type III secretion system inner membrane ring lipoprotein SctJ [Pantoea sp. AMG 501]|uniref:type III secretion system inner membrane ring lipoprotein SctJ n=1 Tax=Pantoea sp. AMG 501 TaxID=2008894 RepID=UPI000B5AAB4B|nr:type III secretion inner membrane ring lipoprotein SctJ [Pantoea sp. AMG 501]OWY74557.1 EscJ/YscJ/HrcJ family type III secretion inner membrane ring protein [Pantoea sp. AMG 501]
MMSKLFRCFWLLLCMVTLSACHEFILLNNLTQKQANQVLVILQQHNIAAQKSGTEKTGYSITAGQGESTAALSIINQYQLPWADDVQISQAFPEGALVASPNAEKARVISMQEQRLEQTLRVIVQVVNARVHISYPSFNNENPKRNSDTHVSVLISYKGGVDDVIFIPQVKSLIKNSIENLNYENISVVLFPAPGIQYASPVNIPSKGSQLLFPVLITALIIAVLLCAFCFYRLRMRTLCEQQAL